MNYKKENIDIAWCPGCGDFLILKILKEVLNELEINPKELVICSGIGQAAKTPHYLNAMFITDYTVERYRQQQRLKW
jgi:2-oxoglutarate ferredoxin oxidoreductase subunit beta